MLVNVSEKLILSVTRVRIIRNQSNNSKKRDWSILLYSGSSCFTKILPLIKKLNIAFSDYLLDLDSLYDNPKMRGVFGRVASN